MSSNREKPSRLSMGILNQLRESTRRNVDDVFGDIVDPSAPQKPSVPAPVPAFRAIAEEPPKAPAPPPPAAVPPPSPEPTALPMPASAPVEAATVSPISGEGERPAVAASKPGRRAKPGLRGEPCTAHPGESKRENLVSVRFTPEQMEDLEHWAEAERLPLAVMCRDLILKEMHRNRDLIQKIREFRQGLAKSSA